MTKATEINHLTYGMIIREFKKKNPTLEVADYRPCCELFGFPEIENAIVIWLKNGTKIIYKYEG